MESNRLSDKSYKGTRDFYPDDMVYRNWYFSTVRHVVESYGYEEYHSPLLEPFDIYAAKSGDEVAKEQLYLFEDKGGRKVAIRPEMTPSVARMVAARLESLTFPLRWYSVANFLRYEKPQKGRLREHWQVNVDIFGSDAIEADVEIVSVIISIMRAFQADETMFRIKISNRKFFNDVLTDILKIKQDQVGIISKAVDKKSKIAPETYRGWLKDIGLSAKTIDKLEEIFTLSFADIAGRMGIDSEGARELYRLFLLLQKTGLDRYGGFDFSIIRGFDYYTGTVFEVYDTSSENRRSLFGGGRYDNLVGMFKDISISGIGFGLGDVTFQHFLELHRLIPEDIKNRKKVLITRFLGMPSEHYFKLSDELRQADIANAIYLAENDKFTKQIRFAEKKGFTILLILGEDELREGNVTIKHLGTRNQVCVPRGLCIEKIKELM
ncbi:MAG: histidine--tRNA ligase [Spirochaetales bacterium]|nr:histidine--tRNA ligase [Spirochaetales bacterium]